VPAGTFVSNPPPGTPDPDALAIFFANEAQSCAAPLGPIMPAGTPPYAFWQLALIVPPALDMPGTVDLSEVPWYATEWAMGVPMGGDISGGGGFDSGAGMAGTMQIVSSGPASLTVTLEPGVMALDQSAAGTYTVGRCDAAP
jgi:hypothetical protein